MSGNARKVGEEAGRPVGIDAQATPAPRADSARSGECSSAPHFSNGARTAVVTALCVAAAAAIAVAGTAMRASFYLTGTAVIVCALVPFFASFEGRKPQARELVVLATLVALAVVARLVFAPIPHFKPMVAVVMIAGIAFGGRTGFLVGALAVLVSNLLFGQGPWTPWQMLAFGTAGLVMGILVQRGVIRQQNLTWPQRVALSAGGFALVVCVVGPLLDTCSLFMMASTITPATALVIYGAGLPVNLLHGAATFLTLLLAANPLLAIFARVRAKYGLLE